MKIALKVPKIYSLLSAVFIITISVLGAQQMPHQAISQVQAISNNSNNNTIASSSATLAPSSNNNNTVSSNSSISIQLSKGYVNGKIVFFIATDASDNQIALSITNNTGFKVNYAPNLALTPESARQQGYVFINGIKTSESPMGFQLGVASALPGENGYSPLSQVNFVKWNANTTPRILKSAAEIMTAESNGELIVAKTNIVINSPAVVQRSLAK
jgi:cytochrome c-type biogenesis protein CcmH/NrfF